MAFSGAQVTRLGLYGGTRGLYGSFAGKTVQIIAIRQGSMLAAQHVRRTMKRGRR